MADASRVHLDPDMTATVAALNAGITTLNAAGLYWIARPIVVGTTIVVAGSPLPAPGYFANTQWYGLATDTLEHDMTAVDAFMASFGADLGVQADVPTSMGYHLFLVGQAPGSASGDVLEFNYQNQPGLAASSIITIDSATLQQSGSSDTYTNAALMSPFTYALGYRRNTVPVTITVTQASGFLPGQTITIVLRVYGDTNPTTITFSRQTWVCTQYPLPTGGTSILLAAMMPEVHHAGLADGVRITMTAALGFALAALESDLLVTAGASGSVYGLRTV